MRIADFPGFDVARPPRRESARARRWPNRTRGPGKIESLAAELRQPFDFTKGAPVLRVTMSPSVGEAGLACVANWHEGSCLFDLQDDPGQETPIDDPDVVARLTGEIVRHLDAHDAPKDAYRRYGLEEARTAALVS